MAQAQGSRNQLWKRYYEESQEQLQALDGQLEFLGHSPWEQAPLLTAQGIFHNFAGSGTLYAAPQISALGGEGEYMCSSIAMAGRAIREGELEQIEALARRIRTEFQRLISATAQSNQSSPLSGIPLLFIVAPPSPEITVLEEYLTKRRVQVETLHTVRAADHRLGAGLPDFAVVRVQLQDGSGYDFVRSLRALEASPSVPILLLGEEGRFLDKVEAIHCGADGFVPDPPDPATVFKKLKTLMAKRRAAAARILAIEDDPAQARYLEECLSTAGYNVKVNGDPAQFEAELHAFHPQLVLMDILLPGVSGYDLVRFMRQEEGFSTVPAIFITTEGQRRSQILAAEAGGDDFLVKPVAPDDLLSLVKSRLARSRGIQDLMDHDEMTGLLSHMQFLKEAHLCLSRHSRRQIPYAMVLVQPDRLPERARRLGAKAEDALLQGLSKFLQRKVRQTDIMGRYSDRQFAVVLEQLTGMDAARLIRRLQQEFSTLDLPVGEGIQIRGSFSAGIAMVNPEIKTLKDWLDQAMSALQEAVRQGGDRTSLVGEVGP